MGKINREEGRIMYKYDLKLSKFNISKFLYRELYNFCHQYPEKKDKLKALYGIQGGIGTGMPRANNISNPTEKQAMLALSISKDLELIENTAKEIDIVIYQRILDNACYGIPYEKMIVPMGRRQFYLKRRMFFYLLAANKNMI